MTSAPALYDAGYRAVLAEKYKEPAWQNLLHQPARAAVNRETVLIDTRKLPEAKSGDLLAVYSTGAYGYSMASNYNRLGRPCGGICRTWQSVRGRESEERAMRISMIWK